eukprot:2289163-Pleurochrysis_carterae.AAC.1
MVRSACRGAPCSEMPRGAPPPGLGMAPRDMMRAPGSVSSARGSSWGAFAYQPYTSVSSPISAATASMPPSTSYTASAGWSIRRSAAAGRLG